MTCEQCEGDSMVSQSKRSSQQPVHGSRVDLIKRRRQCLRCNLKFNTFERRADDSPELWQALEDARRERDGVERKLVRLVRLVNEVGQGIEVSAELDR